ncbi:alpha-galactosidase [Streptococcus uberis]|uniref:alpha-galactosidase n=1 Tax=Streptococcus uberis TaxID=1349 RepID=UPI001FF34475|nr:alpha-galactosidase [Streptococcus uberis]
MIEFHEEQKLFHIKSRDFSYILQVIDHGILVNRYFGKSIKKFSDSNKITYLDRAFSGNPTSQNRTFSLDTLPLEFSSTGLGDFRTSSLEVLGQHGSALSLSYQSHRIYQGKEQLSGLPSSYDKGGQVESLEIDLYDSLADVTVTLYYHLFEKANYLVRSAKVTAGQYPVKVNKLMSFTVDLPRSDFKVHTLTGRYGHEKEWNVTDLPDGRFDISSIRGASSHSKTPFMALANPDASETQGDIYSAQLVYSGNFRAFVEKTALKTSRFGMGINDDQFSWRLEADQSFQSPEVLLSYTDKGFRGLTKDSQAFVREHICRGPFVEKLRPILINNWEATYFDFTEAKLHALAEKASQVGIELFVLDDGWFGKRNSDTSSLGDWYENTEKLPSGLKGLAQKVNDLGMQFGLWVEPEMISEDSDLYRLHPDWAIQTKGRAHTYSREQLVLDYANPQVCDYIVDSISKVLESANISYIKWDMNRNMTNLPEAYANHENQEFFHRYILGLYDVLERLTQTFPDVLFESCSGGGGRYDLGMLHYMPQTWASDNTDAIGRLSIQEGTSLIYPSITMGSHVSASPNHQTGRHTSLHTRGDVAMLGNLGYELDLTTLSDKDLSDISQQVKLYKGIRETIQLGDYYRLAKTDNYYAYNYVSKDQSQFVFTFIKLLSVAESPSIQVKLSGLDPEKEYYCQALDARFYGDELMNIGLTMPHVQEDYFSVQYIFNII